MKVREDGRERGEGRGERRSGEGKGGEKITRIKKENYFINFILRVYKPSISIHNIQSTH